MKHRSPHRWFVIASSIVLAGFGACRAPYRSVPATAPPSTIQETSERSGDAWSQMSEPNAQAPAAASYTPHHDVEPQDGSRMYLLDLYQQAMDAKDALVLEMKSLDASLEKEMSARADVEKERDLLAAKVKELEERATAREAELSEFVARLTTAQIRRLEAEKMLLEAKIEAERLRTASAPKSGDGALEAPAKDKRGTSSPHKP